MNAVIYARYSSYNQTERSIEGQIEDCMAYAERMSYTVIGSYIDRWIAVGFRLPLRIIIPV